MQARYQKLCFPVVFLAASLAVSAGWAKPKTAPADKIEIERGRYLVEDGKGSPARKLVDRSSEVLRSAGFQVDTTILKGATSDAIIDAAAEWDADLIVLASHVRTAAKRFLFGSVSDAVVHQSHCSVELVRIGPLH